ncbi:hypothetical protein J437_LFUL018313 [Ladona fulva]|uniref:Glucose-6-phosphate 1-dehydrogenase n=1 Tax=Ladona fulva TaxID=123851 RepID=A0A8K0PA38_LADFU|nr:hypothetical protein J437_LFUL018313 [Ladona fulva]
MDTGSKFEGSVPHIFVTLGASGDLARKKIYPTLWWLYRDNLLPNSTVFYGYARTKCMVADLREKCDQYMKKRNSSKKKLENRTKMIPAQVKPGERGKYEEFWKINHYVSGAYNSRRDFELLNQELLKIEKNNGANRLFYLALPPSVFEEVTVVIRETCMGEHRGWNRIIIEKPFGRDAESSARLSEHLSRLFKEEQIYRIDHYLGKEMVQNLMTLSCDSQDLYDKKLLGQ